MIPKYDNRKVWDILLDDKDGIDLTLFMAVPSVYKKLIDYHDECDILNGKRWVEYKDEKKLKAAKLK